MTSNEPTSLQKRRGPYIYIEIPIEDYEEGDEARVAKLNLSLYGTRDAAQNWAKEYTGTLLKQGFEQGRASPCNFKHVGKRISMTVHGDDFTATGPQNSLIWLENVMKAAYDIKSTLLGPEEGMRKAFAY